MISHADYPLIQRVARLFCGHDDEGADAPSIPREEPLNDTYRAALTRLQSPSVLVNSSYLNRRDGINWDNVDPQIKQFAQAFTLALSRYQVPAFVHNAYRSHVEQNELFKQGVTKAKGGQSAHNFGCAVDIVHYGYYWELTRREWELFGALGKDIAASRNISVVWGGDWTSIWDPAHWELSDWRSRR